MVEVRAAVLAVVLLGAGCSDAGDAISKYIKAREVAERPPLPFKL